MVTLTEAVVDQYVGNLLRRALGLLYPNKSGTSSPAYEVLLKRDDRELSLMIRTIKFARGWLSESFRGAVQDAILPDLELILATERLEKAWELFFMRFKAAKDMKVLGNNRTSSFVSEWQFAELLRTAGFKNLANQVERKDFWDTHDPNTIEEMFKQIRAQNEQVRARIKLSCSDDKLPQPVARTWGDARLLACLQSYMNGLQKIGRADEHPVPQAGRLWGIKLLAHLKTEFARAVQKKLPCLETASLACELLAFWDEMVTELEGRATTVDVAPFGCPAAGVGMAPTWIKQFASGLKSLDIEGAGDFAEMVENGKLGDITQDLLRKLRKGLELKAQELSGHLQELIDFGHTQATGYNPPEPAMRVS